MRRLCGRYAQLRSDFSPLSSWCHLLTPKLFAPMESVLRVASLQGLEAAWVGLTIAEALLSVDKPLPASEFLRVWLISPESASETSGMCKVATVTGSCEVNSRHYRHVPMVAVTGPTDIGAAAVSVAPALLIRV
jgi:hypothetical protein